MRFFFLVALAASIVGCSQKDGGGPTAAAPTVPAPGPPAPQPPSVTVKEVPFDELDQAITDRKGKVVVVDFWATWCVPCMKKFPQFVAYHKDYKDKGLECVSVSMDKQGPKGSYDKERVLKFLKDQNAVFANFIVADPDGDEKKIAARFGMESSPPFKAVFGKDGKKVWDSESKKLTDEEMVKLIETELAK